MLLYTVRLCSINLSQSQSVSVTASPKSTITAPTESTINEGPKDLSTESSNEITLIVIYTSASSPHRERHESDAKESFGDKGKPQPRSPVPPKERDQPEAVTEPEKWQAYSTLRKNDEHQTPETTKIIGRILSPRWNSWSWTQKDGRDWTKPAVFDMASVGYSHLVETASETKANSLEDIKEMTYGRLHA